MITYRALRSADLPDLTEIIWKKWATPEVRQHPQVARYFGYLVMHIFAVDQNCSWVAVDEDTGRTVGMLLTEITRRSAGSAESGAGTGNLEQWERRMVIEACETALKEQGFAAGDDARLFDERPRVMHEAFGERIPDAEMLVFAVDSAYRGRGIGRELFDRTVDSLSDEGAVDFYLHSDSSSSFTFYEHRGIERIAQMPSDLRMGDHVNVELYLYAGTVADQKSYMMKK